MEEAWGPGNPSRWIRFPTLAPQAVHIFWHGPLYQSHWTQLK